jgi:hypothetical protein
MIRRFGAPSCFHLSGEITKLRPGRHNYISVPRGSREYHGLILRYHVRWVPCHHGTSLPQVADGGDGLQIWRVVANILNKHSRTSDKGWSSSLAVGREADNSSP